MHTQWAKSPVKKTLLQTAFSAILPTKNKEDVEHSLE